MRDIRVRNEGDPYRVLSRLNRKTNFVFVGLNISGERNVFTNFIQLDPGPVDRKLHLFFIGVASV